MGGKRGLTRGGSISGNEMARHSKSGDTDVGPRGSAEGQPDFAVGICLPRASSFH